MNGEKRGVRRDERVGGAGHTRHEIGLPEDPILEAGEGSDRPIRHGERVGAGDELVVARADRRVIRQKAGLSELPLGPGSRWVGARRSRDPERPRVRGRIAAYDREEKTARYRVEHDVGVRDDVEASRTWEEGGERRTRDQRPAARIDP